MIVLLLLLVAGGFGTTLLLGLGLCVAAARADARDAHAAVAQK